MTTPEALAFADEMQEHEDKSLTQYDCERLMNLSSAEIEEAKLTFKTALRNFAPTALRILAARVRELETELDDAIRQRDFYEVECSNNYSGIK